MNYRRISLFVLFFSLSMSVEVASQPATGPLRVSETNPRYFSDQDGRIVYLTGSHTWYNLVDMGPTDPPPQFDFTAYLDWMKDLNHNFIRMWTWELTEWNTEKNRQKNENPIHYVEPHPWQRTGPGSALDGKPKFDLTKYNPDYFDRILHRVKAAGDRGIYVSVMLFEGWGMQFAPNAWKNHPFHKENNVNGIDGDANRDGKGLEIHTLGLPEITAVQELYVKKVVDTVNHFDNVLYEISNENHPPSTEWQYHMIEFIHDVEAKKPKQHPVGMTFQYKGGSNQTLFDSPAEWISPNHEGGYRDNPPVNDGKKVVLSDTDHLWGIGGNQAWVWKSFTRGLNPIFMDPYDGIVLGNRFDPKWDPIRRSMGYTLNYANRMDLEKTNPRTDLASSDYCLANPGQEYLVYLPEGGKVAVDLSEKTNQYSVEWFDPTSNKTQMGKRIDGGAKRTLKSPFGETDAVLFLNMQKRR